MTVRPDARTPYVLELQYYGEVTRRTDRGLYVSVGSTVTFGAEGCDPGEFGPFAPEQLLPGWKDSDGNPRL